MVGTNANLKGRDFALVQRLRSRTEEDPEYWSFRWDAKRRHAHALFQYPAMMVPQMLSRLFEDVTSFEPEIGSVYDPFVGSGTVLTEAMLLGLNFVGRDINPLAVLLSRVKAGPFHMGTFGDRLEEVLGRASDDRGMLVEAKFKGWQKWFHRGTAIRLSRIVRAIRRDSELWSRRFFWVALAETVRLTSNSRTSTYKLHIRSRGELALRSVDPLTIFEEIAVRNIERMNCKLGLLEQQGMVERGRYKGCVKIELGDTSGTHPWNRKEAADLLVTSPPYGDNETTVPYGQYSFLPLQWIDLDDIDEGMDRSIISNTHCMDTRSLGGERRGALVDVGPVVEKSPSLSSYLASIRDQPRDRSVRVCSFWRDLDNCLSPILEGLRPNAYMIWIVGNRRVGNTMVPMHSILAELLESRGAKNVHLFERRILSKRMAVRNGIARTMSFERILVMRKGSA